MLVARLQVKEIINEEFCSNYGIKAPLSSFSKNGPHIFFEVNNIELIYAYEKHYNGSYGDFV